MTLKFYNTLTNTKEEFIPIEEGKVGLYTCGPTVYNYAHIGNFRTYVFEDLLRRYLKYKRYEVNQVMNITDVDDKTIRDSQAQGVPFAEFTKRYTDAFFKDIETLRIEPVEHYPRATDFIPEMVEIIKTLLDKGFAYKSDDGSVYFSIAKFPAYGKLANIKVDELKAGARVSQDEYEKDNAADFALWKAYTEADGEVFWETELGKGRPGWHIECSAMSMKHLGPSFDMHTGGVDNMFPHHEDEIAQSEAANDIQFVKYWLHSEHLLVEGKKMSKSLGNFFTLRDLLDKGYDPVAIRYLLLTTHYKQQLNFTLDGLDAAKKSVGRLKDFMLRLDGSKGDDSAMDVVIKHLDEATTKFEESLDDDLNISGAMGVIFDLVNHMNKLIDEKKIGDTSKQTIKAQMESFDKILDIMTEEQSDIGDDIDALIKERDESRVNKDWARSDEIRDQLKEQGIILEDTADGTRWKKA